MNCWASRGPELQNQDCFIEIINSNVLFQRFYMCHENGRSGRFTCPVGTLFSESLGMDYLPQDNSMTNSGVC